MSKKITRYLSIITGIAAVILLAATITLSIQAGEQKNISQQSIPVYLTSNQPMVILLQEPDPGSIVATILARGTPVEATDYSKRGSITWYHVVIDENISGWVQAEFISIDSL